MPLMFFKLLRYDLVFGFRQNKYKYCIAAIAVFVLCLSFYMQSQDVWVLAQDDDLSKFTGPRSISDYFIFITKGIEIYDPGSGEPFNFPMFWAIVQILIALLVATYPTSDLRGFSRNVLFRTTSRSIWWYAKVSWTLLTVLSFYLLGFAVVVVFALAVGDITLFPVSDISLHINNIDARLILPADIVFSLSVGMFASMFLAVAQVVLSFVIKAAFSFMTVMAYIVASTFFHTPILMADYSMLLRNGLLLVDGLSSLAMIIICIVSFSAFAVIGGQHFKRCDIL